MKISYNWLKDYVKVTMAPEKLAEVLTMAGLSVESVKLVDGDHIFEIEITANRPDWLSIGGVAREVAALTGAKLIDRKKAIKKSGGRKKVSIRIEKNMSAVSVKVDEKALAKRYTARVIRNVTVKESPDWLKKRIEAMGSRPVNNIVDITNFCLFETGEPMHAFDLDLVSGHQIVVRMARPGEKITVIDGAEKALDNTMLVIADNTMPIAIAGVMGGKRTEVTEKTKNILLEAAFFDQISIRRTARKLSLATESSYRFERRVDIGAIADASDRAARLILELAGGELGEFIDIGAKDVKKKTIELKIDNVEKLLGIRIPVIKIKSITAALGMKIVKSSGNMIKFEIPNFRNDINAEVDIIEEIARVYGYDKIPSTLPKVVEQPIRMEREVVIRNMARTILTGLGAEEILTYSLLSKKMIVSAGIKSDDIVNVANPLTSEQEVMRPSLIPGMLGAIGWNLNRKAKDLKLFEIGNVYYIKGEGFGEKRHLSIGITGQSFTSWAGSSRQNNFYELKGMAENIFSGLGITGVTYIYRKDETFLKSECADILIAGKHVGAMGQLNSAVLADFDIKEKVYILEIDLDQIVMSANLTKHFRELPKYPSVFRDISLLAVKGISNFDIVSVVKIAAGDILRDVNLIDRYAGPQIPGDKVSLTYRLEYQDLTRTLQERDVQEVHINVLRALEEKYGVKLR